MIQAAKKLGWNRQTVWRDLKRGIDLKLIPTDKDGVIIFDKVSNDESAFIHFGKDSFERDELIKLWVEDMRDRRGGKGLKSWRVNVNQVRRLCNTLKIKPYQLAEDRSTFKQYIQSFKRALEEGKDAIDVKSGQRTDKISNIVHAINMGCRSFAMFHGVSFVRGTDDITSGKVINHGQYKDVRLSLEQIKQAEDYIIDKWGLDSDIFRIFSVGIESASRRMGLLTMELNWYEHKSTDGTVTFHMKAYESKTDDNWTKYIRRPRTQESLRLLKLRNAKLIWNEKNEPYEKSSKVISNQLKEIYRHLQVDTIHNCYFVKHPFHALRHVSAQVMILLSNGNLTLVRKVCGWRHDIELEASYGELPPELIQKQLDNLAVFA